MGEGNTTLITTHGKLKLRWAASFKSIIWQHYSEWEWEWKWDWELEAVETPWKVELGWLLKINLTRCACMSKYAKAASKTFAKRLACIIINEWIGDVERDRERGRKQKIAMAVINAFRVGTINGGKGERGRVVGVAGRTLYLIALCVLLLL